MTTETIAVWLVKCWLLGALARKLRLAVLVTGFEAGVQTEVCFDSVGKESELYDRRAGFCLESAVSFGDSNFIYSMILPRRLLRSAATSLYDLVEGILWIFRVVLAAAPTW